MSRITFEIPQYKHPFIGLGTGIIVTENGREEPRIVIKFPLHGIEIVTATGEEAKSAMADLNSDECFDSDRIKFARNTACEALHLENGLLDVKTRKEEIVFARWLVWDYAKNVLKMSLHSCGDIFNLDHATVMWGVKQLNKDNVKFLTGWRKIAYEKFWESMKAYAF